MGNLLAVSDRNAVTFLFWYNLWTSPIVTWCLPKNNHFVAYSQLYQKLSLFWVLCGNTFKNERKRSHKRKLQLDVLLEMLVVVVLFFLASARTNVCAGGLISIQKGSEFHNNKCFTDALTYRHLFILIPIFISVVNLLMDTPIALCSSLVKCFPVLVWFVILTSSGDCCPLKWIQCF